MSSRQPAIKSPVFQNFFKAIPVRVIILSLFLTVLLAISNTYLALKVGMLTAASIPAAILSMGLLRFSKEANLQDHNLVQTAASSGEAIAGGIGYTLPAFIMIGFMANFDYWSSFLIASIGGILGIVFSSFIRPLLMNDPKLQFPEARAIAEILNLSGKKSIQGHKSLGFFQMFYGALLGAFIETLQNFKGIVEHLSRFFTKKGMLFGSGISFSPALIGAGYIMGLPIGLSLLIGAIFSYGVALPYISHGTILSGNLDQLFQDKFSMDLRYTGVGAMVMGAIITILSLVRPLFQYCRYSISNLSRKKIPQENGDLSLVTRLLLTVFCLAGLNITLYQLLHSLFNSGFELMLFIQFAILLIFVLGFFVTIICGYFSGLLGVSASPGSSIMISTLICLAPLFHAFTHYFKINSNAGEMMTLIAGSIIMQIACISNDTVQDLKVGHLVNTPPRLQQIMLIFGVLISAAIVPLVMQILYNSHGFLNSFPRPNMDASSALSAPPAAIMTALTEALFNMHLPLHDLLIGAGFVCFLWILKAAMGKSLSQLSLLSVGIGMYLNISLSTPLIIGALLNGLCQIIHHRSHPDAWKELRHKTLLACGLLTGATFIDVILAIPMALNNHSSAYTMHLSGASYCELSAIALVLLFGSFLRK